MKDHNPHNIAVTTDRRRRYMLILLGNAGTRDGRLEGGVVNLFAHEEPSRDRVSANLNRSRAVDTDVSFIMTRNERKKTERWIGTCRDGKGMKFPPFTMSAINGRTALHPLQVSRFVARRALWASARFNRIIIGRGWEPTL